MLKTLLALPKPEKCAAAAAKLESMVAAAALVQLGEKFSGVGGIANAWGSRSCHELERKTPQLYASQPGCVGSGVGGQTNGTLNSIRRPHPLHGS